MTEGHEYKIKDRVKIKAESGYYWVHGYSADGSLTLWGGDADPNGYRCYRNIMPEDVKPDTRSINKKSIPSFVWNDDE